MSIQRPAKMIHPGYKKKPTEVFVCDSCGARKRLERNKRHWCDVCTRGTPIEMRRAQDKWRAGKDMRP